MTQEDKQESLTSLTSLLVRLDGKPWVEPHFDMDKKALRALRARRKRIDALTANEGESPTEFKNRFDSLLDALACDFFGLLHEPFRDILAELQEDAEIVEIATNLNLLDYEGEKLFYRVQVNAEGEFIFTRVSAQ